jgi:hypothetical protein
MTLTTHRSPVARALHAAVDLAVRLRRGWQARRRADVRPRALYVLDDAALRDLGLVHSEFAAYGAEARGEVPRTWPGAAHVHQA